MENHSFKVEEEHSGQRLDVYLTQVIPAVPSRVFVQNLITEGKVKVNQKNVKAHYKVSINDVIEVEAMAEKMGWEDIAAEKIPLDIIFEDDDLMVINKPAGMLVHPATGVNSGTLVNALLYHCKKQLSDVNTSFRPGIVHRLDRETSGLMVVAKNNRTHANISRQFEKRIVRKKYLALVEGIVQFDEGLIDASLGRDPRHFDKKTVIYENNARKAKTFYMVLRRFKNSTLIALYPKTGRTHQLRVHMAHLGHPIFGDDKYGKKNTFPRLALHAQSLGFFHPGTTHYIEFSIRPPQEFLNWQ